MGHWRVNIDDVGLLTVIAVGDVDKAVGQAVALPAEALVLGSEVAIVQLVVDKFVPVGV